MLFLRDWWIGGLWHGGEVIVMRKTYLLRNPSDEKQTLGAFVVDDGPELFVGKTLELPNKGNKSDISCIPADQYICKWTFSPHLGIWTYEVTDVPNRTGIRIHSANYFKQLLGCIAFGDTHKDINADNELDVIHSGNTVKHFNEIMNKEDFLLVIVEL